MGQLFVFFIIRVRGSDNAKCLEAIHISLTTFFSHEKQTQPSIVSRLIYSIVTLPLEKLTSRH